MTCCSKGNMLRPGADWCSDFDEGELFCDTDAAEWRAAAYERAATRPCTDLPTWTLGGRRAKRCRQIWLRDGASCGGTP